MAVMIPHTYKGEDFKIIITPAHNTVTGRELDKWVRCIVSFTPINDKQWESDMLVAREMTGEPKFYDYVCAEAVRLYHKSIVKDITLK